MATTKESLVKYFTTLDVATLEKLKKYSELLIIPDEDLLTNATMIHMVNKAHSLADSLFPEWTDRSKSDFGEFLVELFALYSEKDFWYMNAFANEGILSKMRSYSNAFSKASTLGYYPTTCKSASADFAVTFEAGEETYYGRGELLIKANGKDFSNDAPFTVADAASETTINVNLQEGKQVAEDVTYNGHSIFLSKANIDIDSISVTIGNIAYKRVNNFGDSAADSCHFMVLPEENGACSIYFGTGGFGVQPSLGKLITVEYRICDGLDGNVGIDVAEVVESSDARKAIVAAMITQATGGLYAESLSSIRAKAPVSFAYRRSAMNVKTAESLLNSISFVYQSKVWTVGRDLFYSVVPKSGRYEPSVSEIQYLRENFEPCLMIGLYANQTTNNYVDICDYLNTDRIILDVIIISGYKTSTVEEGVRQVMDDITNPLIGATYGQRFSKADIDVKIRSSVAGVQSVSFRLGDESIIEDFQLDSLEIFRKINQIKLTVRINAV